MNLPTHLWQIKVGDVLPNGELVTETQAFIDDGKTITTITTEKIDPLTAQKALLNRLKEELRISGNVSREVLAADIVSGRLGPRTKLTGQGTTGTF